MFKANFYIFFLGIFIVGMCLKHIDFREMVHGKKIWHDVSQRNPTPEGREYHQMSYLEDNKALLFGGYNADSLDDTWIYDYGLNKWSRVISLITPPKRHAHSMECGDHASAFLFGGKDGINVFSDLWFFDLGKLQWEELSSSIPAPSARYAHSMVPLGNSKILLFGGKNETGYFLNDTWLFDTSSRAWEQIRSDRSPVERYFHSMSFLKMGYALLFGGISHSIGLNDTWVFNLHEKRWEPVMLDHSPSPRRYHAMEYESIGNSILYGGYDGSNLGDTWLFNSEKMTWTKLAFYSEIRASHGHSLVNLGDGGILLFAGNNSKKPGVNLSDLFVFRE
jgi:N-acetylneuraminic acid mutarotase